MRFFAVTVGLIVIGLIGCHESTGTAVRHEEIVGGVFSSRQSVVALNNDLVSGYCTATMITSRVAVTAKHCVQRPGAEGPDAPSHYQVRVGDNVEAPDATLSVQALIAPPGIYTSQSSEEDGTLYGVDVGLVVLAEASDLPVQPIRLEPPINALERSFVTVGYGRTEEGETGHKREVQLKATNVMSDRIIAGPVVCLGDSGGPLIQEDDGVVVGVTSYGIGACGSGSSAFNTFAGMGELFASALEPIGGCLTQQQCPTFEVCVRLTSAVGECQPRAQDAALDGSFDAPVDAATADAQSTPRVRGTAAGGACRLGSTPLQPLWWLFAIFALARRSLSLVASPKRQI